MEIKTDINGNKFFEELPTGWRIAKECDFFNDDQRFYKGKAYLVHSFHTNRYETYRTTGMDSFNRMKEWIEWGRVYVLEG